MLDFVLHGLFLLQYAQKLCGVAKAAYLQLSACELQTSQSVFTALKLSLELLGSCGSLSGAVQLIPQRTHAPHLTLQRAALQTCKHTHSYSHTSRDEVKEGFEQIWEAQYRKC